MARPKSKPDFDRGKLESEILKTVVEVFQSEQNTKHEVAYVAEMLEISALKARKLLITAGDRAGDTALYYSSDASERVQKLYGAGKSLKEIEAETGLSHASVVGYLPYTKIVYTMWQVSIDAERIRRFRVRQKAITNLRMCLMNTGDSHDESWMDDESETDDWKDALWNCISLYQGLKFKTAGRGKEHKGAIKFTYQLKVSSRTGETTDELIISTRPDGKTITRSSVELALTNALAVQKRDGFVSGPKKCGQIFGISYLYAVFLKWGVITDAPFAPA